MTVSPTQARCSNRARQWLLRWISDPAILRALAEENVDLVKRGKGHTAYFYITRGQADDVLAVLADWERQRMSGTLPHDPTKHDRWLFTNPIKHIRQSFTAS